MEKLSKAQKLWNEKSKVNINEISSDHVADVVSLITGIPVNKVAETESSKLLNLPDSLSEFIVGQKKAIHSISKAIRRARTGLKSPSKPIGVFFFLVQQELENRTCKGISKLLIQSSRGTR